MSDDWRSLRWLPRFEVSADGKLRRKAFPRKRAGSLVRPQIVKGYVLYRVSDGNGGRQNLLAHRLVCEAFHGPPNILHREVAHWDGNRSNNHYTNLRWVSPAENAADRTRHGTQSGENASRAKLNWETVRNIRSSFTGRRGEIAALARLHGVHRMTIRLIVRNKTWKEREVANV